MPLLRFLLPLALLLSTASLVRAVESGFSGSLSLLVEDAIRFGGMRDDPPDLHIELDVVDGKPAARGWAYLPALPAMEHPVTVKEHHIAGMVVKLTLQVDLQDQFPYYEGGQALLALDMRKYGRTLRGNYTCQVTTLTEQERKLAWKRTVKADYEKSRIRGGVWGGKTQSRQVYLVGNYAKSQPIIVRGSIEDRQPPLAQMDKLAGLSRPRLLGCDLAQAKQLIKRADGARYYASLIKQLSGSTGGLRPGEALPCESFGLAGRAFQAWLEDDQAALAGLGAKAKSLPQQLQRTAERRWFFARELAGLAICYDLAASTWTGDERDSVAGFLARSAWHIAGLEGMVRDSVFNDKGLLGTPRGSADPRLGLLRSAAGLAALAVLGEPVPEAAGISAEQVQMSYETCVRSVHRFLNTAFGERGCPIGHSGIDEAVELAFPFAWCARQALATRLAWRTGGEHVPAWIVATDGSMFDDGGALQGPWLPLTQHVVEDAGQRAGLAAVIASQECQVANPFQAIMAIVSQPPKADVSKEDGRRVHEDPRCGTLALRSGPDRQQDFLSIIETAQANDAVSGAMGRFSIRGLGRQWVYRRDHPSGRFSWPDYRQQNLLFIDQAKVSRLPPVLPVGRAQVQRVRVTDLGTGSIGWRSGAWAMREKGKQIELEEPPAKTWTTIGVDYSKASGADMAMVVVSGYFGFKGRPVTWSMDIGNIAKEHVRFENTRFIVSPPDTDATMVGTVVYPPTLRFEYVPPSKDRGALVNTWMKLPPPDLEDAFFESLTEKILDVEKLTMAKDSVGVDVDDDLDFEDLEDIDGPDAKEQQQRNSVSKEVKSKVFRVTTSTKMGSPYLRERVNNHVVVVLTIQKGKAPPVKVAPLNKNHMLTIGDQIVHYWEYLVEFERGMRDVIRAKEAR